MQDTVRADRSRRARLPVVGCWVRRQGEQRTGLVQETSIEADPPRARVHWKRNGGRDWVPAHELRSGFELGMEVQDVPASRVARSLGEGEVLENRTLGGRDQVLVEFPETGVRCWLPFERLRWVRGVRHAFLVPRQGAPGEAARYRLRSRWNCCPARSCRPACRTHPRSRRQL